MNPSDRETSSGSRPLAIAVFCGALSGVDLRTTRLAEELGTAIGQRRHHLIYGAGGSGLMGAVAWAASRSGARISGYAPRFIQEREIGIAAPEQDLHITDDMFDRKRLMILRADGYIALPGGFGTLDEVLDVLSLTHLNVQTKPLVLLDADGFWGRLAELAVELYDRGHAIRRATPPYRLASTVDTALAAIETAVYAPQVLVGVRP